MAVDDARVIYRWVFAEDSGNVLAAERRDKLIDGTHLIGYVYVDSTCGMSLSVEFFYTVGPAGEIQIGGGPRQQNSMLLIRYEVFKEMDLTPVGDEQRAELGLPARPEWLHIYEMEKLEPLMTLPLLHPLRAAGFPLDIKFFLPGNDERRPELVWGRLKRLVMEDHYFECELLNEPEQDFGYHRGEKVLVSVREIEDGLSPVCLGIVTKFTGSEAAEK